MVSQNSYNIFLNNRKSLETGNYIHSEPCTLPLENIDGHALKNMCASMLGQVGGVHSFRFENHSQESKELMMTSRYIQRNTNLHFLAHWQTNMKHSQLCNFLHIQSLARKQREMFACS